VSHASRADSDGPKSTTFDRDMEVPRIQLPLGAHLQSPPKETRSRKETPSMMTQATATSTNSYSQAVITYARKNPVVSAIPKTMFMNTMSSKHLSNSGETSVPHESRRITDSGTSSDINSVPQKPALIKAVSGSQRTIQPAASVNSEVNGRAGQDVAPRISLGPYNWESV